MKLVLQTKFLFLWCFFWIQDYFLHSVVLCFQFGTYTADSRILQTSQIFLVQFVNVFLLCSYLLDLFQTFWATKSFKRTKKLKKRNKLDKILMEWKIETHWTNCSFLQMNWIDFLFQMNKEFKRTILNWTALNSKPDRSRITLKLYIRLTLKNTQLIWNFCGLLENPKSLINWTSENFNSVKMRIPEDLFEQKIYENQSYSNSKTLTICFLKLKFLFESPSERIHT